MKNEVPFNFGGLSGEYNRYETSAVVIQPLPFDKTSTWGKGADKGPRAIIDASRNMELYDIETNSEIYEKGIYTAKSINATTPEKLADASYEKIRRYLSDNKFVVSLGGEHSVSAGPIKAHMEKFKNASVLHLDAHSDRRDSYLGSKYNHACIMARVQEWCDSIVSVGIRSMDSSEIEKTKRDLIIYAHEIDQKNEWIDKAIDYLRTDVYLTIDLDVFDSGIMPSTGTPEPGGLSWQQVNELIKKVAARKNIIGFDVVELAPNKYNKAPDFLAAKLIYRILSEKFSR